MNGQERWLLMLSLLLATVFCWPARAQQQPVAASLPVEAAQQAIEVPAGTTLSLALRQEISTRTVRPGHAIYFETTSPVAVGDRVVIPAGWTVRGEVVRAKGRRWFRGHAEIVLRLTHLILPNGDLVPLSSGPTKKIQEQASRTWGWGTRTVATGAIMGYMMGMAVTMGGEKGKGIRLGGMVIGGGLPLLAGLLALGPELELPRGAQIDVVLQSPLLLDGACVQPSSAGRRKDLCGHEQVPTSREVGAGLARSPL